MGIKEEYYIEYSYFQYRTGAEVQMELKSLNNENDVEIFDDMLGKVNLASIKEQRIGYINIDWILDIIMIIGCMLCGWAFMIRPIRKAQKSGKYKSELEQFALIGVGIMEFLALMLPMLIFILIIFSKDGHFGNGMFYWIESEEKFLKEAFQDSCNSSWIIAAAVIWILSAIVVCYMQDAVKKELCKYEIHDKKIFNSMPYFGKTSDYAKQKSE